MESRTQDSRPRPRPKTQNNPRRRTDPLEAKDRNAQGQGQGNARGQAPRTKRASVFREKKVFLNLPRGLWRVFQDEEQKRSRPWPIFY